MLMISCKDFTTTVGSVTIGKPEWQVCKASHCGSKQQQR